MALLLAACGDDEEENTPGTTNPTEATSGDAGIVATSDTQASTSASEEPTTAIENGSDGGEPLQFDAAPEMQLEEGTDYKAVLHTSEGDITIDILEDAAPVAANNFVFLAQEGYYTNVPFHRILEGFMMQGGDPTGTGAGGPGYTIQDEPVVGEYTRGTVAMARTGAPNSAGSQFFIMHADVPIDKVYVIFGQVLEGIEVVDAISTAPVGPNPGNPQEVSSPQEPITLNSVDIITE